MSRPIIRTTGGPNLRRRRDLIVLAFLCCLVIAGLVVYVEIFRHPHVQTPVPAPAVSVRPALVAPAPREA
jgi:hypothetical protein